MKSPNPVTCALMALGFLGVFPAFATEMYYKGDLPGGITNCQNYCRRSNLSPDERYDRLPGPDDEITIVGTGMSIDIDDGHFDFLKTIKGINLKQSKNFRCNLHIEQDQTMPCWIADYSGYGSWRTGRLVKTGPGDLYLCTNITAATSGGTSMSYDIREGDLYLHPPYAAKCTIGIEKLTIAEGCTVHAPSNTAVSVYSLEGAGTFTNDATVSNDKDKDLTISGGPEETEPTVFSGRLRGKWYVVNLNGYTYFTGTENDFDSATRGYSSSSSRLNDVKAVGFMSYPATGISSLGTASRIDNRNGPLRLRYLGTEPTTAGRGITVNDTTVGPTTIDGGAWGGLTWSGYFDPVKTGLRQQRVAFTGTNAGQRCEFSGRFTRYSTNGTNFSFHVTKDGPGTWRFLHNKDNDLRGALTVREGTLEYDTIFEANRNCALGFGSECYPDVYGYTPDMTPVDWAWRLGDADDSSATGTLRYVGTTDRLLTTRKTAVAGAGRLSFIENSLFKYAAGISGLGTGEKSIGFDSAAGATNVVSEISDGDGTLSVFKEGAGTTVLTGNLGFSGDVRAEAGELVFGDVTGAEFRYYRINLKENVSTSVHPGLEAYRKSKKSALCAASFGLFDAKGKVAFTDPGDTNVNVVALEPGHGQFSEFDAIKLYYNAKYDILAGIHRLFGGDDVNNCAAGTVFSPEWKDGRLPTPGDPSSWYRIYVHLADGVEPPVSWDLCYHGATNTTDYVMNVTALSIDASADGMVWEEVASTNNIVHFYNGAESWLSNPDPDAWLTDNKHLGYPQRQEHPKIPFSATHHRGTYARPTPRSVFVRRGATLRNESATKIQVSGLALDKSGMGTLQGFSLSASGTLSVEGLADERAVTIPADFSTVSGYENLADWTLVVNGVPSKKYAIASVSESGITLTKHGLILIFR